MGFLFYGRYRLCLFGAEGVIAENKEKQEIPLLEKLEFQVGDMIEHPAFGEGEIIRVNLAGQYYEIDFPKLQGTRQIVFRAKLKKKDRERRTGDT